MDYTEARPLISNGDLISCSGKSWESWVIRWWTGAQISHVGLAVWLKFGDSARLYMLESTELGGVRLFPLSLLVEKYVRKGRGVWWQRLRKAEDFPEDKWTCKPIDGDNLAGKMLDLAGAGYPRRYQFLLMALGWLRWLRQKVRRLGEDIDAKSYHCAEAVVCALDRCGAKSASVVKPPVMWTPLEVSLSPWWSQHLVPLTVEEA